MVAAELVRLGLSRLSALAPKAPARRYERARPGDLIHLDVKKLARFDKPGHRVARTRRGHNDGVGWEFVHVCIDDHARLAYVEVLDDEAGDSCARFLARGRLVRAPRHLRAARDDGSRVLSLRRAAPGAACKPDIVGALGHLAPQKVDGVCQMLAAAGASILDLPTLSPDPASGSQHRPR